MITIMKKRLIPLLALAMALIFVNTSLARLDLQLCQTRCEYSVPSETDSPPCCNTGESAPHDMAMAVPGGVLPVDCPHIDGTPGPADSLFFLSSSARLPVPPPGALFTAAGINSSTRLPGTGYAGHYNRWGLSPPDRQGPPPYRLYCSLLI
jgi:hypothetical protein